jgi:multiple sugar transport system ATP-binding protein
VDRGDTDGLDKRGRDSEGSTVPEVQLDGLTKTHRGPQGAVVTALHGLTLAVADGELLVVVGPSGSGKTTALRLVAGLDAPDAGSIRIGTRDLAGVPPHERGVAMVFQDHPLFPHLTVAENVGFGLRLRRVPSAEIARRVDEVSELLGLGPLLSRRTPGLSGGERQRVAVGMALVRRPDVLLLDEPLAHLDPPQRVRLRDEIRRLQRMFRLTTIHVTHDRGEAVALGDRIAVLRAGELQQVGTAEALRDRPANPFVAEFWSGHSSWPGVSLGAGFWLASRR